MEQDSSQAQSASVLQRTWSMIMKRLSKVDITTADPVSVSVSDKPEEPNASLVPTTTTPSKQSDPPAYSYQTLERAAAAKGYFERYFDSLLSHGPSNRFRRRFELERELASRPLSDAEKRQVRQQWLARESSNMRLSRQRLTIEAFDVLQTIGHGAFGKVLLVREMASGEIYAMKVIRKVDALKRRQEGHVRAERDILMEASGSANWIVKLIYSFEDADRLYMVMEFMAGGDLLSLLIKRDTLTEDEARFYLAEVIMCVDEAHRFGYVHRDIKPDNFLLTREGHLKLTDFGLATDFHWAHDAAFYELHRTKTYGNQTNPVTPSNQSTPVASSAAASTVTTQTIQNLVPTYLAPPPDCSTPDKILIWRQKNRRHQAFSIVGTNNYMAPEVLESILSANSHETSGYDASCDWWSVGVMLFEMLYGYPPFCAATRQQTRAKILHWRKTLKFPERAGVSIEARDLIARLCCDKSHRLGRARQDATVDSASPLVECVADIKAHPFFRGIDFDQLHLQRAPCVPELSSPTDTRHFDPISSPKHSSDQANAGTPKESEEDDAMQWRKQVAFTGFAFRSFQAIRHRPNMHLASSSVRPVSALPSTKTPIMETMHSTRESSSRDRSSSL